MVATLRQIVTVEAGGVIRIQSDQLHEGVVAEVVVTTGAAVDPIKPGNFWKTLIGVGEKGGRSVEEIDASIRQLRDEWP